jgi:hypothetical protein
MGMGNDVPMPKWEWAINQVCLKGTLVNNTIPPH